MAGGRAGSVATTRFPVTYSRLLARELQLDEAGQAGLLAGTTLTPAALSSLDREVGAEDQYAIIRNALALSGDPAFGLHWGRCLYYNAHGALGQLMVCSPTLADGLQAASRFADLRGRFVAMTQVRDERWLIVHVQPLLPLDAVGLFFMEALLASTQRNIESITGRRFDDGEFLLGWPAPAHAERYRDYLHSPCRFGEAGTCIRIPVALAETPNPCSDADGYRDALRRCEQISAALRQRDSWQQRVSALLAAHPGQLWTQQEVADHFGVSSRSLIRHLKAEGTSYQVVLDALLGSQARELLASPRYTVEAVALTLGYHDVSAFRRAFRRWFGMSPAEYKQQLRAPAI